MRISTLVVASLLLPSVALATDSDRLVRGCEALVQIYDKQEKSNFLAGFTTSVSDAIRAGYCRGVIDEYLRATHFQCGRGWRSMADRIVTIGSTTPDESVDQLLRRSCGR